jgi:hypothetical protein
MNYEWWIRNYELGIKVPELDSPEFIEGPKDELGIKVPELDSPEFIEGPKDELGMMN